MTKNVWKQTSPKVQKMGKLHQQKTNFCVDLVFRMESGKYPIHWETFVPNEIKEIKVDSTNGIEFVASIWGKIGV